MIVCVVNMFDAECSVISPTGKAMIPLDDVSKAIPSLCFSVDDYDVHFIGTNKDFIKGIADKITQEEAMTYGYNKIKVEVD